MNENKETNKEEIWKPIVGYENLYEVSNIGRVRSLDRFVSAKLNSVSHKKGQLLKPRIDHKGYARVCLSKNGKGKHFRIHRLVALTFILNPNNLPQVNHKTGNKLQNNIENLEWITNLDNMRHAWKNGLKNNDFIRGENHPKAILTSDLVRKIKQDYIPRKFGPKTLAKKYGVARSNVKNIVLGKTWKHLS